MNEKIERLHLSCDRTLESLHRLQKLSYAIEAEMIGFWGIPPLIETKEELSQTSEEFFGIWEDAEVVAAVSMEWVADGVEICRLTVLPRKFRQGLGEWLIKFVLSQVESSKFVRVSTGSKNVAACRLYEKLGFSSHLTESLSEGVTLAHFVFRPEN